MKHARHHEQISATTQQPMSVKYTQLRQIKPQSLPCLDCEAAVGQPCVSSTGKLLSAVHVSRHRMATRAYLKERGIE
jgi:hypothetical protein